MPYAGRNGTRAAVASLPVLSPGSQFGNGLAASLYPRSQLRRHRPSLVPVSALLLPVERETYAPEGYLQTCHANLQPAQKHDEQMTSFNDPPPSDSLQVEIPPRQEAAPLGCAVLGAPVGS